MAATIDAHPDFVCVAGLTSPREAFQGLAPEQTDIVLLNRDLPELGYSQAMDRLRRRLPRTLIYPFGVFEDSDPIFAALTGVSAGYLLRRRTPQSLLEPILPLRRPPRDLARAAFERIRDYFQSFFAESAEAAAGTPPVPFSPRERQIVQALLQGMGDKEMASQLEVSVWTARKHLHRVYRKLGVRSRTEAVLRLLSK